MHETGHSHTTVVDRFNLHKDVCTQCFLVIGGVVNIFEVDVSKFGKRKYNERRYKDFHWVFGGV